MILFRKAAVAFRSKIKVSFFHWYSFLKKTHTTKIAFSYLAAMFVIVNKYFPAKRFEGMALWPFIFVKQEKLKYDAVFINHERIHFRQQLELCIVLFFIFYFTEYFIRLLKYRNSVEAYRKLSFEREAYANEKDVQYLKNRKFWAFLKYM